MSDEYGLDETKIEDIFEVESEIELNVELATSKRELIDATFLQMGFGKGKMFTFNDLITRGSSGVFQKDWDNLKLKLPASDIEALSNMFRVQTYVNFETNTILVNPEALSGSDASIWGVLSLTEHAILADLARDTFFREELEEMYNQGRDPVIELSKKYKLINLLDLQKIDATKQSISIPDPDSQFDVPRDEERASAAILMSRLYKRTATLAPNKQLEIEFRNLYSNMGLKNIEVFTDNKSWVSHLAE